MFSYRACMCTANMKRPTEAKFRLKISGNAFYCMQVYRTLVHTLCCKPQELNTLVKYVTVSPEGEALTVITRLHGVLTIHGGNIVLHIMNSALADTSHVSAYITLKNNVGK